MMDNLNKTGNMVNLSDLPVTESLIEYPSDFPIKIMGPMHETFTAVKVSCIGPMILIGKSLGYSIRLSVTGRSLRLTMLPVLFRLSIMRSCVVQAAFAA